MQKIWTGGPDWLDCGIISEDWNLRANTVAIYGYHQPNDEYTILEIQNLTLDPQFAHRDD